MATLSTALEQPSPQTGAGWGAQSICLPPETQGPLSNDFHLPLAIVLSARCPPAVLTVISWTP